MNGTQAGNEVRKITPADFGKVEEVVAKAFYDDPVMRFFLPADDVRGERLRQFMGVALRKITYPYGETYVESTYRGAALWNPPNQRPHGILSDLSLMPAMLRFAGLSGLPRIMQSFSLIEGKHPKEAHYYLLAIGVDPSSQGQGLGTRLMAPVLERCDTDRAPAYLEASSERSAALYERNGFKVIEELKLPRGGPPIWRMWREPQ